MTGGKEEESKGPLIFFAVLRHWTHCRVQSMEAIINSVVTEANREVRGNDRCVLERSLGEGQGRGLRGVSQQEV